MVWDFDRTQFAQRFKKARKDAGLTQFQLAEMTGVHGNTIFNLEHGKQLPGADTLAEICRCTGADPAWLLGLKNP